ncbi:MAG TPA: glycosyltransferase family 4 protein [Nitrososphaerales archaeon]|nr:glycosyltransferase family 4 protein [Nitrososphaerales archaeon]
MESVLFLTYHFPPEVGGIQTRIAGYLSELSRRGIKSTVLIVGRSAKSGRTHDPRKSSLPLPSKMVKLVECEGGIRGVVPAATRVLITVGSGRADVVHVFTGAATLLGVLTLLLGRLAGRPSTMSVFGREDISQARWFDGYLFCLSGTLATSISTNSASTGSLLPPKFRRKSRVLLGGSAVPLQHEGASPVRKSVLFVGRLVKRKGLDDLLKAFAIAKAAVPEATLVIVGDGPEREDLVRQAKDLGIADSVHFKGTLLGQPLASEYEKCTLCVLPSKVVPDDKATEGLGLALVEASMHGKPLVGTDHGGISEIIKDRVNGFIVPQGETKKLSDALGSLLNDAQLASTMGTNSLRIAKSQFTMQAATDRLLESYSS